MFRRNVLKQGFTFKIVKICSAIAFLVPYKNKGRLLYILIYMSVLLIRIPFISNFPVRPYQKPAKNRRRIKIL